MAENTAPEQASSTEQPKEQFVIQKIYVKDVSFETPNSPKIFTETWEPQTQLELSTEAHTLDDNNFEVVLKVSATLKIQDKTAFLIEVQQAGIVGLSGFDAQKQDYMLNGYTPGMLFPYAREVVADMVMRGGFQPLILAPVNFDAYYAQRVQQLQQQAQQQAAAESA